MNISKSFVFFIIFCFFISSRLNANDDNNWHQLYYTPDGISPVVSFNSIDNDNLENLAFDKFNLSRSYRRGKKSSNLLINEGNLFLIDYNNNLVQFSLDKRKVIKKTPLTNHKASTVSGMAFYEDHIYITFETGALISFSLNTNSIKWSINVPYPIDSSPVVSDNKVFFIANNTTYAVSISNGNVLWSYIGSQSGVSLDIPFSPTLYSQYLFLGLSSSDVIALRQEQGELLFKTNISSSSSIGFRLNPISGDIKSPIIPFNDEEGTNILVGSNNKIMAFNLEDQSMKWQNAEIGTYSTPAIIDNNIILLDTNGNIINMKSDDGEVIWKTPIISKSKTKNRIIWYGPIQFNDNLLVINSVGEIMSLSKKDGSILSYKRLFSFKKEKVFTPPIITSDYIIVFSNYGNLYINETIIRE